MEAANDLSRPLAPLSAGSLACPAAHSMDTDWWAIDEDRHDHDHGHHVLATPEDSGPPLWLERGGPSHHHPIEHRELLRRQRGRVAQQQIPLYRGQLLQRCE